MANTVDPDGSAVFANSAIVVFGALRGKAHGLACMCGMGRLCCMSSMTSNMIRVSRKPVFRVSDQAQHKLGCTVAEGG